MKQNSRIYVAGHAGLVGSAILRRLQKEGFTNLITRSSRELDLTNQAETLAFFEAVTLIFAGALIAAACI